MSVKILIVGAGGYAHTHTRPLLDNLHSGKYEISGVVEISDEFLYIDEFKLNNIPLYKTMEDFFENNSADLVLVNTPPHIHAKQCIYAVEHGANVMCEKPIASSYADAIAICEAAKRTGKFIAVGYQYSYTKSVLELKADVLAGVLGKPKKLKTIVLWPRNWQYYGRSCWAGHIKDKDGTLVLDSVISNATAHYLHNMLFVLGEEMHKACLPYKCSAELLRGNKIESYDTAVLKMQCKSSVELMMVATHASERKIEPMFEFYFENGVVYYDENDRHIIAQFKDGKIKDYGDVKQDIVGSKQLWDAIDAVETGVQLPCDAETAMPHNIIINKLYEKCEIQDFPSEMLVEDLDGKCTKIAGLDELLVNAFKQGKMLSEIGCDWVKATEFYIN